MFTAHENWSENDQKPCGPMWRRNSVSFRWGFGEEKNMEKAYVSYKHGHPHANCTQKQQDAHISFAFACIQMWCIVAGLTSITRSNGVVDIEPGVTRLGEIYLDVCECTGLTLNKTWQNFQFWVNNSFNKWCFWWHWIQCKKIRSLFILLSDYAVSDLKMQQQRW